MKGKKVLKSIVNIILLFGITAGLFYWMINRNETKNAVSITEVETALTELGFAIHNEISVPPNPPDSEYANKISATKDDVALSFYEFDNNSYPRAVYEEFISNFYNTRYESGNRIVKEGGKNFLYFACNGSRYYSLTMYVDNTVICAYCDIGSESIIQNVLSNLNYI